MVYQLLNRVIRYVLTWFLIAFVGSLSPRLLPSWHALADAYKPNRTIVSHQLFWATRPPIGVCYLHSRKNYNVPRKLDR
jgi:hypothetical protein